MEKAIQIQLMDSMGGDLTVVNAARVSFNKESVWVRRYYDAEAFKRGELKPDGVFLGYTDDGSQAVFGVLSDKNKKLIRFLAREGHTTPFRHVQLQFRCKAPIFLARQLGKHQTGFSWNEVSRRYVDEEPEFYIPECWRKRPEDGIKQGSAEDCVEYLWDSARTEVGQVYKEVLTIAERAYNNLIHAGVAPEMARMVLPQSMLTEWVWTGSLYGFFNVWKQRTDGHAQKEAQYFAELLDKAIPAQMRFSWETLKEYKP